MEYQKLSTALLLILKEKYLLKTSKGSFKKKWLGLIWQRRGASGGLL
jgi:hypothetical protein